VEAWEREEQGEEEEPHNNPSSPFSPI
jgi:hypothetical protein